MNFTAKSQVYIYISECYNLCLTPRLLLPFDFD